MEKVKLNYKEEPFIIWKCMECGDKNISYPMRRHDMNMCKCGGTGVDAEDLYCRRLGNVEMLYGDDFYNKEDDKDDK